MTCAARFAGNYRGNAQATGDSLDHILKHVDVWVEKHARRVVVDVGRQVLAMAKSWEPDLKLNSIKLGFHPQYSDDRCFQMMDSLLDVAQKSTETINLTPVGPTPPPSPRDEEVERSDVGSSPPASWFIFKFCSN